MLCSQSQTDRLFALSRLKQSGAFLTTTEAVLLQLVQDAKHPNFKEVLSVTDRSSLFECAYKYRFGSPPEYNNLHCSRLIAQMGSFWFSVFLKMFTWFVQCVWLTDDFHFVNRSKSSCFNRHLTLASSPSSALCRDAHFHCKEHH